MLCDGVGGIHDPACALSPVSVGVTLAPGSDIQLLQRRADRFLREPDERRLEVTLMRGATMALLKLINTAMLPGGKDPDVVGIRATRELIQMGEQWLSRGKDKTKDKNRDKAPDEPTSSRGRKRVM